MILANIEGPPAIAKLGKVLGGLLVAPVVVELVGDLGAGKTTLVKSIVAGLGIGADVDSPSFSIENVYAGDGINVHHYDFYRLSDAGVMKDELREVIRGRSNIILVEWGASVADILPDDRVRIDIKFSPDGDEARVVEIAASAGLEKKLVNAMVAKSEE